MVIWLTGIPGLGQVPLAKAIKKLLHNGKRIQILDADSVRRWMYPAVSPTMEEQTAAVAWVTRLLTRNDIDVIVCCMAPDRQQRVTMRHIFFEEGTTFHEVWVDGKDVNEALERRYKYEHPDPPDARAIVTGNDEWETLARRVIFELDL